MTDMDTERRQVKARIDDDLDLWLTAEAERRGLSRTKVVEIALNQLRCAGELAAHREAARS